MQEPKDDTTLSPIVSRDQVLEALAALGLSALRVTELHMTVSDMTVSYRKSDSIETVIHKSLIV